MAATTPIRKYSGNPHYFEYDGKPLILISSGDIYYDVFSPNQDFREYLDTLASYGHNFTRMYPAGCTAFVPTDGVQIVLPWVRLASGQYDLDQWNPAYFERLHAFMDYAQSKDIIVDACMFNGFHTGWPIINWHCWPKLPFNAANNIQGDGTTDMNLFTTLKSKSNVKRQKAYIRKICQELAPYNNLLYDNVDEPDCYGQIPQDLATAWTEAMLAELHAADAGRHMIAQTHIPTMERDGGVDWCRDRRTSWTNAEYLWALKDIAKECTIDKPYVLIETISPGEHHYWNRYWSSMRLVQAGDFVANSRIHAWAFLVGGGGGFLEWSANYHPGVPSNTGVQPTVNAQKKLLKEFLYGFDFVKMHRFTDFDGVGKEPTTSPTAWATAIAEPGRQYALYLSRSFAITQSEDWYNGYYSPAPGSNHDTINIEVPAGTYRIDWVDPASGTVLASSPTDHSGGRLKLQTPAYEIDVALRMVNTGKAAG